LSAVDLLTLSALITAISAVSGLPGASSQIHSALQVTSPSSDCMPAAASASLLSVHFYICVDGSRNQRLAVWPRFATRQLYISDILTHYFSPQRFNNNFLFGFKEKRSTNMRCMVLKESLAYYSTE